MQSLFGTDGIRASITSPLFSHNNLVKIGSAIGVWIVEKYGPAPRVLIGSDTRHSKDFIKKALTTGLNSVSVSTLDAQVLPTPAAAYLLQHMPHVAAALIISASHNPAEDNGIKLFDQQNGKITGNDEETITHYFYENNHPVTPQQGHAIDLPNAHELYQQSLMQLFAHVRADDHHIVLDTAHGATSSYAESLFKATGAQVSMIHNRPNGYNINRACGSTSPHSLQEAVDFHGATLGFAFDGDGDRVIAVNQQGTIKDGDDILSLLLDHPDYATSPAVVGTIMTNEGLAQHLFQKQKHLIRTCVGDRSIGDMLQQKKLLLGGEPTGHTILKNHLYTGDGMLVALKVLETIVATNNREFETFTHYPQVAHKILIKKRYNLHDEPFASIVAHAQKSCQNGRVVVRYSGTEPVLRVMVETTDIAETKKQCALLTHELEIAHNRNSYA